MKADIYFEHYRPAKEYNGSPVSIGMVGGATLYKAIDGRSGAPVVLTLLPIDQIPEETRTSFEEQARATLLLDHVNIVRTVEFGREGADYAFIFEYPQGETLKGWVEENGPMSPDAVLRVALQVVNALGAASFHRIIHRDISPVNIVIVSGQTAEGGWPAVKLQNFPVAGITRGGEGAMEATEFASPEQLSLGNVDFRSEIYSLGGTICFLLTGSFYTAEPRSLQTRRFAKPLRRLITPMLRQNPSDRPHDPMLVAEELRSVLQRVERRQSLARRFGIPFVPVATRRIRVRKARAPKSILAAAIERPVAVELVGPEERTRRLWPRRALAIAAILLAAATVAAMLLPAPVSMILRRNRDVTTIGVPVGVAQPVALGPAAAIQKNAPVAASANIPPSRPPPNELTSSPADFRPNEASRMEVAASSRSDRPHQAVSAQFSQPPALPERTSNASEGPAAQAEVAIPENSSSSETTVAGKDPSKEATPPGEGLSPESEPSPAAEKHASTPERSEAVSPSNTVATLSSDKPDRSSNHIDDEQSAPSVTTRVTKNKPVTTSSRNRMASPVRRAIPAEPFSSNESPRSGHRGSVRAQFAGVTPDGGIVLRFPNGQTAVVPPPPGDDVPRQQRPRRSRRVIIERGAVVPPQSSAPVFPPDA